MSAKPGTVFAGEETKMFGPNSFYIVTAYGVTALVFSSLIVWTLLDYRRQSRAVAELEALRTPRGLGSVKEGRQ